MAEVYYFGVPEEQFQVEFEINTDFLDFVDSDVFNRNSFAFSLAPRFWKISSKLSTLCRLESCQGLADDRERMAGYGAD